MSGGAPSGAVRWLPAALILLAAAALAAHGPIPQLPDYNQLADRRALWGIPNAGDVLSNIPFLLIALWGVQSRRYPLFFGALLLTAFESANYHLAPDDDRLFWDRIGIAFTCAGLLDAYRDRTFGHRAAWFPLVMLVLAVASTLWWRETGDLRPYILMQGAPLLVIPLWQWICDAPRADRIAFAIAIALYAVAKVFEFNDRAIFEALGVVSGHTLKHLAASAAAVVITVNITAPASTRPP